MSNPSVKINTLTYSRLQAIKKSEGIPHTVAIAKGVEMFWYTKHPVIKARGKEIRKPKLKIGRHR